MARLLAIALLPLLLLAATPARAGVLITFWSHELGNSFPHAFFTLRGVPDAGGAPVEGDWGFTPVSISPKILFGPVKGKVEQAKPAYLRGSDAQFSVMLTDGQYAAIRALIVGWSEAGDPTYRLETRNCVHFVKEAARIAGLAGTEQPGLMKKPRSYLRALAAANAGRVTVIGRSGRDHLPTLAPIIAAGAPAPAR